MDTPSTAASPDAGLTAAQKATIGFFVSIGLALAGYLAWRELRPAAPPPEKGIDYGDMKTMAERYLRKQKAAPLSGTLVELLKQAEKNHVPTRPGYPLLGKPAPEFDLVEALGQRVTLKELLAKGPVVLIFYYGYHCDHCVSQLFDLNEDLKYFQELGAQVVAVSADPSEQTLEKYQKFGRFRFPVLSDPGNKVAQAYGVYLARTKDMVEFQQHGAFVIGRDGKIAWAMWGDEPFTGNPTLLYQAAKLEGKLP